ncbi:MAG TPA: helix-turn-helix domain-containing protein [Acidimicrobiales bacterium]
MTTSATILEATRQAMTGLAPERLSMSAVARAAGVSRPTLYRWFPTKEDLLAAVAAYEEEQFTAGLREVIDLHPLPAERLDAALRYLVTYLESSAFPEPIGDHPAFALRWLAEGMPRQIDTFGDLLGDALDTIPAVAAGEVSRREATELLLRLAYSHFLIPHSDSEAFLEAIHGLAGVRPPNAP